MSRERASSTPTRMTVPRVSSGQSSTRTRSLTARSERSLTPGGKPLLCLCMITPFILHDSRGRKSRNGPYPPDFKAPLPMKRDMDLARRILLEVEADPKAVGQVPLQLDIEGRDPQEISYHV